MPTISGLPCKSIKAHACIAVFEQLLSGIDGIPACLQHDARIMLRAQRCKLDCEDLASYCITRIEYNSRSRLPTKKSANLRKHLWLVFEFCHVYIEPFFVKKANPNMAYIFGQPRI